MPVSKSTIWHWLAGVACLGDLLELRPICWHGHTVGVLTFNRYYFRLFHSAPHVTWHEFQQKIVFFVFNIMRRSPEIAVWLQLNFEIDLKFWRRFSIGCTLPTHATYGQFWRSPIHDYELAQKLILNANVRIVLQKCVMNVEMLMSHRDTTRMHLSAWHHPTLKYSMCMYCMPTDTTCSQNLKWQHQRTM